MGLGAPGLCNTSGAFMPCPVLFPHCTTIRTICIRQTPAEFDGFVRLLRIIENKVKDAL